jgi:MFS family permease
VRFTRSPKYKWVVLFMGFMGVFGALGFGRFGYSAILPSMKDALGITNAAAGSLASWNLGGYVIMCAVGGVLASRYGPRKIVSIGTIIAALGMLVTGIATGMVTASAGRLLTGLGGGMCLVPSVALMSAWFDVRRRGLASGIVTSGSALALVITGPIVPRIISAGGDGGWRWAWLFFAAMTFVVGLLTIVLQRDRPYQAVASTSAKAVAKPKNTSLNLKSVVKSGYAWHLGFIYMMFGFAYMIYFTFFQKRLTTDLGWSSSKAGTLFLIMGITSLACGVIWGIISDRIGRGRAIALMCLIQAIAAVMFAWWPSTTGIVISAAIYGLCSLAVPGIVGAGCGDQFGPVLASASLGFVTIFLGIGQVVGPYLAGWMADVFDTFAYSYLLAAAVFFIGTILALSLKEIKWRSELAEAKAQEEATGNA